MKAKTLLRKIILIPVILSMICIYMPDIPYKAYAADDIGSLNGTRYDDFDDLIDDLDSNYAGVPVTIEMLTDWDAAVDSQFDERLIIPTNCKATLNMNGHVFDRNNTANNDSCFNGELIKMSEGANLTINGGDKSVPHGEPVYASTDRSATATNWINLSGGVLTGGASDNGAGGIHVGSNCVLTMNDVTLAGCRSHAPWYDEAGTRSAYGGGIWLSGSDTKLNLNNSTITGCFAYYGGGGIFQSNVKSCTIELKQSHIDNNYAGGDGGGINLHGSSVQILGDSVSTVNGNHAGSNAGGIYAGGSLTVNKIILDGNEAKVDGGGIYIDPEGVSMGGLTVTGNKAGEDGGGIYVGNDKTTIASCYISENAARQSGTSGSGNGVYVEDDVDVDFKVSGSTVIKGNGNSNLYIADSDSDDSRVVFSLIKGADVWVRYNDGDHDTIMVTPGKKGDDIKAVDCTQYISSDQEGYYFTFDEAANMRKILRKRGKGETKPEPTAVETKDINGASTLGSTSANTAKAGVVGQVGDGGYEGSGYDLIRGFYLHEKTDSSTDDTLACFYYSDGFFYGNEKGRSAEYVYNPHLGTASWTLAFAGTYLRALEEADETGNTYYNKHAGARQLLADIGCPDQMIYVNDSMQRVPGTDTIGVTIGSKELKKNGKPTGDILIPITVRGGGYESEWASNVTLGTADETSPGKEAKGFATAADNVIDEVNYYLKKYELEDEYKDGKVIFWVSGFSRAGATANLTSKRLVDKIAKDGSLSRVFGYPCEAPKGGTDAAEVEGNDYECIHNMINTVDVVPYVGTTQMGFKRYGVDHYIPGTDAGYIQTSNIKEYREVSREELVEVTTHRDNVPYQTKTDIYWARSPYMKKHLAAIDSHMVFDDYFHPMTMDFIPPSMYEKGKYDGNRAEDFVTDFIRLMQEGLEPTGYNHWSQAVTSREYWAENLQPAMRDTMSLVFSMSEEDTEGFINRAMTIIDKISYIGGSDVSMREIYDDVIGDWHTLTEAEKSRYTSFFWKKVLESGALDYLSEQDRNNMEKNWPVLADFIFRLVDADWNNKWETDNPNGWANGMKGQKMTYLPTFATFSSYILSSHYPEINIAWARTYDSYYQNGSTILEPTEYTLGLPPIPEPPEASVFETVTDEESGSSEETEVVLKEGEDENNDFRGDRKIILENKEIVGEAVYYDLYDVTDGGSKKLETNKLYQGGLDLTLGDEIKKSYKLVTYDMSYGVKSDSATYNLNIYSGKHKVLVEDKAQDGSDRETESVFEEGSDATVMAGKSKVSYFTNWTVSLLDGKGDVVRADITDEILGSEGGSKATDEAVTFKMPEISDKYPEGYTLKFTANYADKISEVKADPDSVPTAGEALPDKIKVSLGDSEATEYPVTWVYTYEDEEGESHTVITSGKAYRSTEYTAVIRIDSDPENGIIFAEPTGASTTSGAVIDDKGKETDEIMPDDNDGSILLRIKFDPTQDSGGQAKPEEIFGLTLNMVDLNAPDEDNPFDTKKLNVLQGQTITLSAPQAAGETFVNWTSDDFEIPEEDKTKKTISIKIPDSLDPGAKLTINACYVPVVKSFDVKIDAPKGGNKVAASPEYVKVTIDKTYTISPDCYKLTWSPEVPKSGEAEFFTEYTAAISMVTLKDEDGEYIEAFDEDGNTKKFRTQYVYAEDLEINATTKDEADKDQIASSLANTANSTIYVKFNPTQYELAEIKTPSPVSGLSHDDNNEEGVTNALPPTVKILTENGIELDAKVTWTAKKTSGSGLGASTWEATGTVELPSYVGNTNNIPLEVKTTVSVKAADTVASPVASSESGTYLVDQYVTLESGTKGATIYYTLDGSDPSDPSSARVKYEGEEIAIKRADAGDGSIVINAVAVKDGMYDSNVATYEYSFTNEMEIPAGKELNYNMLAQIGVDAGPYYTLEAGDGVTIDKSGNAVATNAGTYTVIAKAADGFKWTYEENVPTSDTSVDAGKEYYEKDGDTYKKVEPAADDDPSAKGWYEKKKVTTDKDQKITFKINPSSLKDAVVEVLEDPKRIENGRAEPKVKVTLYGTELPEEAYTVKYSNNTKKGTGKVTVVGNSEYFSGESDPVSFKVLPEIFTITYDLNGGSYNGQTEPISIKYEDGEWIRLLDKPTKDGYEFSYWKGSKYKAKASYLVSEDHTFVAQWKKPGAPDEEGIRGIGGVKTGDENVITLYIFITLAALAGLIAILVVRRARSKDQ